MNPKVDGYLRKNKKWHAELSELRRIILACDLTEDFKWRNPCYTVDDKNIIILGAFKESAVISFVKGALLKDPRRLLVKPGENTQSARIIRFTNPKQILDIEPALKAFIHQAVAVEKSGQKVKLKTPAEFTIPEEFQKKLDALPKLKTAFTSLTPGRQRAYLLFISSAKQSKTRESRVEKCMPRILAGKGMDD